MPPVWLSETESNLYHNMAIEIIPKKKKERTNPLQSLVLLLVVFFFLALLISSAVFFFLEKKTLQEVEMIEEEILQRKTGEVNEMEQRVKEYTGKTERFLSLLDAKKTSDPVFDVIEKIIHPLVFLEGLDVDVSSRTANLIGVARNVAAFDQQVKIIEEEISVTKVDMVDFKRDEDGSINFSLEVLIDEDAISE